MDVIMMRLLVTSYIIIYYDVATNNIYVFDYGMIIIYGCDCHMIIIYFNYAKSQNLFPSGFIVENEKKLWIKICLPSPLSTRLSQLQTNIELQHRNN